MDLNKLLWRFGDTCLGGNVSKDSGSNRILTACCLGSHVDNVGGA